ncbi:MAG TPA: lipid A biosynthesis acyltransferase [Aequorivita sp.]|jgi:predicted LPLAT superfamily acyltransferase|nr:lipid A biosynthesis acyltransferase [Aequorivita sp.]MBP40789.1 lipid A biosynthesis acyltransferase [Aequorivita sp.]HNP68433.1 lipid A biosynthesis acyltransferase [Aequorivita sp.]|tara:strand:- start:34659 stop:35540 length:882 start_codon:yes stop_codon:yes gene_type:complete
MAGEWEGKSKGTVLGYKIFIFFIRKLGVRAAYGLLYFVALYYVFFAGKSTRSIYYYFRKRLKYARIKSFFSIYKSYYVFGKTIIDKAAISSGLKNRFTHECDGVENIIDLLDKKQGGIMISAHVGNFEIAEFFFEEIDTRSQISLVTTDAEHKNIKEYMEKVTMRSNVKFILVKDDMSHIFEINNALSNGELVCFTGDRYMKGQKLLTESLMGKEANFPAGPFLLASRLNVPVLFVYVMKETNKHYHLYARQAEVKNRDAEGLLKKYTESVEWMLKKYPLQWFNYFDFWETDD